MKIGLCVVVGLLAASHAFAAVSITEWMYQGKGTDPNNSTNTTFPEYIEITNVGGPAVDLTGWSMDDNTRVPGSFSLSSLGTLAPNESAIITEDLPDHFRSIWSLSSSVKVIGSNDQNLGRSDEINIYDASTALVDRLTYNDQGTGNVKGPRTNGVSAWPSSTAVLATNNASAWQLSVVGDAQNSFTSSQGEIGSPGTYVAPEPGTVALLGLASLVLGRVRRRVS